MPTTPHSNKFVPPGSVILDQEEADALPLRIGSPYENTNNAASCE